MRNVLIAIRPQNCKQIIDLDKTIEVRKSKPKLDTPFKCYIYCTKGEYLWKDKDRVFLDGKYNRIIDNMPEWLLNGRVLGEFICDAIISHCEMANADIAEQQGCIKREKLLKYAGDKEIYGWHISDLVVYDKPKELNDFMKINRECWYATLGIAKRDCSECKNESCFISRPPQSWCYVEGIVYCKNCKHLMFSDCYAECGKGYKGILNFDDFCDKGELR